MRMLSLHLLVQELLQGLITDLHEGLWNRLQKYGYFKPFSLLVDHSGAGRLTIKSTVRMKKRLK